MKTTLKLVVVISMAVLCSNVSAQNIKLAHISMQELIYSMPEYAAAMESLQSFFQDLEKQLEEMRVELNRKIDEFQRLQESWSDLVRQTRIEEIQTMQQRIELFQQNAEESVQVEQNKLMQPILEKANKAIEDVAKAQGVTYVISADPQVLLFKAVGTLDLLPAVKQHLGISD